jgi:hypothetical protein
MPMMNHFWRDADEPWVKVSGETRPPVARWIWSPSNGYSTVACIQNFNCAFWRLP